MLLAVSCKTPSESKIVGYYKAWYDFYMLSNSKDNLDSRLKYRADIDGLRGIAILLVLAFHSFPLVNIPGGFIGVDIFFVISGFLISTIIFKGLQNNTFSFRDFYTRRINRIFPSIIVVFIFVLVTGWFILLPNEFMSLGKHVMWGTGFLSNIVLYLETGYFDVAKDYKPLLHMWSLGIEEQFYLFIPAILLLSWKFIRKPLVAITGLFLISFWFNIRFTNLQPDAAFYFPFTRFWELILGIFLAYISIFYSSLILSSKKVLEILAWLGLALVIAGILLINEARQFPGWWALLPTLGTLLLIYTGPQAWLNRKVFSNRILVFVGLISYPLYLWHWPLLSFTRIGGFSLRSDVIALMVCLSFVLAWGTYKYIEQPIRFGSNKPAKAKFLLVLMFLIWMLGATVVGKFGFAGRYETFGANFDENYKQLQGMEVHTDSACQKLTFTSVGKSDFDYCRFNNLNGNGTVALIGDSHAGTLFEGLADELKKYKKNLLLLATSGCPTFYNVIAGADINDRKLCKEKTEKIFEFLTKSNDIEIVIIATRGLTYLTGEEAVTLNTDFVSENPIQTFSHGLTDTVSLLNGNGKKVFYVPENPGTGSMSPRDCLIFSDGRTLTEMECAVDKESVLRDRTDYIKIFNGIRDLIVIDPFLFLCTDKQCPILYRGVLLYSDKHHLSPYGSKFIAPYIMRYIMNPHTISNSKFQ
ncbi:MAG: hypothetical protein A2735_00485 [Candidatus Yanofskybacteria bacterium RIFCSPHIGHO2_01_FULL_41_21]|uniref:Acyltransferase 3 domain-containing protein n=1 Tax=Candidatus Yanofskybacteria bacterium RIFCSPHIGHO2_01_FULL_41_21 TaxID=1802660 RepID=A0A1F8EB75_9BACT|nr:MAG: hypothetical protein A2735_00485 [Candidatus Yanofskybacteria bacterium RIFCSPHIGHO2_01_FULL_41_21]